MPWFDHMLRAELETIRAYQPAAAAPDAVRLDANESPFPLSDAARRTLASALAAVDLNRYPDVRATRLRERIAEREQCHPDQIILGSGSDEVIGLIIQALARAPDGRPKPAFAFPDPSFVMFKLSSLCHGADPIAVPLDATWDLDVEAMTAAIEIHRPNAIFLPSPNNPTGNLFADERIAAVIAAARNRSLVLLDEAYGRFSAKTYRSLRVVHEHVGQLQTLSKIGLAGARVGWAILPRDLAAQIDKVRQPYNFNALSQRAGELALGELAGEFDDAVARIVAERERLIGLLGAVPGFRVAPSAANFLWVDTGRDAGEVYQKLYARGVIVRSFHASGGRVASYVRVTIGTPGENDRLLEALRS